MAKNQDLIELQQQAEFQRKQLEERRKLLENEPFTIEYWTAAGGKRICENPEWTAYEKLLKSYQATLRAINLQTSGKSKEKQTGIGSPLMNFRNQYGDIKAVKSA